MKLRVGFFTFERAIYTRLRARADRRLSRRARAAGAFPTPPHLLLGQRGEDAAFFHLRALGYTVVARRWTSRRHRGDLDLVAWDGDTLVVAEVRARSRLDAFPPGSTIDRNKRNHLRALAEAYTDAIPEPWRAAVPVRFDILAVILDPAAPPAIEHSCNAFPMAAPPADRLRFSRR